MKAFRKTQANRLNQVQKAISKKAGRAICDYRMIQDKDRILVGISGGKDSLTLLKILWDRRKFVPVHYDIVAVHVDLGFSGQQIKQLEDFLNRSGYPFYITRKNIPLERGLNCFWCSWNRRRVLFEEAKKQGCNKIALGHHKDDIIETILMNLFFEGEISAMGPRQELFKGELFIIRPLAYVEEHEIARFARLARLPVCSCDCPHAGKTQRGEMKKLIAHLEKTAPGVKTNIFRSMQRIKTDYLL